MSRVAFLKYTFCEVAPVNRMTEILKLNQMDLWGNDLLMLETNFKDYKIRILCRVIVDDVYAKAHHLKEENHLDRFFTIITDLKNHVSKTGEVISNAKRLLPSWKMVSLGFTEGISLYANTDPAVNDSIIDKSRTKEASSA